MKKPPSRRSVRFLWLLCVADARAAGTGWWKHPGFWAALAYRVHWQRKTGGWGNGALIPVELPLRIFASMVADVEIPADVTIGPGLYLPHPTGVVVASGSRIGSHVALFQQVTLGSWHGRQPCVRAHASLFAGAKVIGGVIIGRRAFVGANAVVLEDVPEWHAAVGVPAHVQLRSDYCDRNSMHVEKGS